MLALVLSQVLDAEALGGPVNRRRGKDNELDITSLIEPAENDIAEDEARDGRNLANVFPFVGGDRGKRTQSQE